MLARQLGRNLIMIGAVLDCCPPLLEIPLDRPEATDPQCLIKGVKVVPCDQPKEAIDDQHAVAKSSNAGEEHPSAFDHRGILKPYR